MITHEEFETKMKSFKSNLNNLFSEANDLENEIKDQLEGLGYE